MEIVIDQSHQQPAKFWEESMKNLRCAHALFVKDYCLHHIAARKRQHLPFNSFHAAATSFTDGVYSALTEMRVNTPWVEALRQKRELEDDVGEKQWIRTTSLDRDLTPKKMSQSYHRLVNAFFRGDGSQLTD